MKGCLERGLQPSGFVQPLQLRRGLVVGPPLKMGVDEMLDGVGELVPDELAAVSRAKPFIFHGLQSKQPARRSLGRPRHATSIGAISNWRL